MNEEFVTFEIAEKLKEKGYNKPFYFYYRTDDECIHHVNTCDPLVYSDKIDDEVVIAPTTSQVLKWLREEKAISVEPYASASGWRVTICRAYHQDRCDAGGGTCLKEEVIGYNDGGAFEKYEEAALAGIEYVLDNLI